MSALDLADLLNEADALASEAEPMPDLPLPPDYDESLTERLMELRESDGKAGKGWHARRAVLPGTVLLVDKPLAMVMTWEVDKASGYDESYDDMEEGGVGEGGGAGAGTGADAGFDDVGPTGSIGTALLVMRLTAEIAVDLPLWTEQLAHLFPRDEAVARRLPAWACCDKGVGAEMEKALASLDEIPELAAVEGLAGQIRLRLPLVVRYNALSVETAPELFVHPSAVGHASLSGIALFRDASFFNHSARPNVSRWAVGDATFFVANCEVKVGEELCISYVEHEILCEESTRRTVVLDMDFADNDIVGSDPGAATEALSAETGGEAACTEGDHDGPFQPLVDPDVQQELMGMHPTERLESIEELLAQAEGRHAPADDGDEGSGEEERGGKVIWFQCDAHQLRILQALTLDGMGLHVDALPIWELCVDFCDDKLPPLDENGIAIRVQAALCAWALGRDKLARLYANRAMDDHATLFGGGRERFRRRYRRELELNLRPDAKKRPVRGLKVMRKLFPLH